MEVPAMAVGGVTPVLPPLMIVFLLMAVAGAFLLLSALTLRNFRLVTRHGLNPFRAADFQKAADPSFSTRPAGAPPFTQTAYARIAFGLLGLGATGLIVMLLWGLFAR
ncbi:MAG: hypothetical protein ABS76_33740 [Pelagibacterium sp. SCN 64-44]|nr:MAG: hypothetical protein ABS76_33740 [Pelagibacterium sp. SCN 64-44]